MQVSIEQGYRIRDRTVLPLEGTIVGPAGPVHLEPKVIDVLNQLVLRENQIVPIQDLIDTVWHSACVTDACLYGAISHLRKALADGPERRQILQTIHKRGYRLVGPVRRLPLPPATAATQECADGAQIALRPWAETRRLLNHCIGAPQRRTIARLTIAYVALGWSMIVITLATLMASRAPDWYLLLATAALLPPVIVAAIVLRLHVRGVAGKDKQITVDRSVKRTLDAECALTGRRRVS